MKAGGQESREMASERGLEQTRREQGGDKHRVREKKRKQESWGGGGKGWEEERETD